MHPDLAKLLYTRYPEIFADRDAPLTDSLMGFGFCCGDGWFFILDNLCRCIQNQVYGMIKMAECMSRNVCEITGDIGSSTIPPMWATRSPECQEKPTEDQKARVLNFVNQIESVKNNDI
jgi:hypothetical protein